MKQEEINKGNILIAEFMGRTFQAYKDNSSFEKKFKTYADCEKWITKNKLEGYIPELWYKQGCGEYNSSWDWLMPVIEKIVRQLPKGEKENNYIQSSVKIEASMNSGYPYNFMTNCKIGDLINKEAVFYISKGTGADGKDGSLINAVWSAVVQYIKWHNEKERLNDTK